MRAKGQGTAGPVAAVGAGRFRAMRLAGPGRAEAVDLPLPAPGPGEALVRLDGCGVCASNLEPWAGPDWMRFPTEPGAPGHEGWGRVVALGPGTTGPAAGSRVALLSERSFASHEVLPVGCLVPLPAALDDRPFPGEALGCAMNIFRRSGISRGDRVAVVGIGFLGAALTRLAVGAGAEVIAVSRREGSLRLAGRMGARHLVHFDPGATHGAVAALTGGDMCEVAIEAVGRQAALDVAASLVATGGRLVVAGYHQDGPRQVDMQSWNWRGIDVINAHERAPDVRLGGIRAAVAAVVEGQLDLAELVTHSYPLAELAAALDATRDKPEGFVKAWVRCGG